MKNFGRIVWGIVLIAIGIILGGNALGIINVNVFFDGWWTLFIIIPCFIGLFTDDEKAGSLIGLAVGILLLLACREIIDFDAIWKLIIPIIFVAVGLSIILKGAFNKEINENIKKLNGKMNKNGGYSAIFSGQDVKLDGEVFKGTNLSAAFGGIDLDLRNSIIDEDVVINATSVFGGIDIYVPSNTKVRVKSNSIFGGVSNDKKYEKDENAHVIYINATCIFGGVDIK